MVTRTRLIRNVEQIMATPSKAMQIAYMLYEEDVTVAEFRGLVKGFMTEYDLVAIENAMRDIKAEETQR